MLMRLWVPLTFFLFVVTNLFSADIRNSDYHEIPYQSFTESKITYIPMQGMMRNPNSAWGSITTTREGFVYVMVCDHVSDVEIFEYQPKTGKLFTLGTISKHLKFHSWADRQPKVHSQLCQNTKDGLIYFGTDAGDMSEEAAYDQVEEGYRGGFLCTLNPITKEVKSLGMPLRYGGIKTLTVDSENDAVYILSANGTRFLKYDIKKGTFEDLGRVNGYRIPRTLFEDSWKNIYISTESAELVRYNPTKAAFEFLPLTLPFNSQGVSQVAYGPNKSYMYFINAFQKGDVCKYTPEKDGPGKLDSLGFLFTDKRNARNMNFANNKIYAVCTDRERTDETLNDSNSTANLVVFDPEKKVIERKILLNKEIGSCYGPPNRDVLGNCYVVGWTEVRLAEKKDKSSVYLIKFNPNAL